MDRTRQQLRRGLAIAALFLLAAAGPSTPPQLLRAQAWTAPGEDLAHALTHTPSECLARRDASIETGRALFRSPVLLGGPAARAGLSCEACHANGSINTRFLLPELTDRAGHADVTSEWASRSLGDGRANPIPIPDLVNSADHAAFGQRREPSLDVFVRGVIEDEFQGAPPPAQAFEGLIAYLQALRLRACPARAETPISLASTANDVRRALAAARTADTETASLLLASAQDAVGRIVERLPAKHFRSERARFETLARELGAMRAGAAALQTAAPGWLARFDDAVARIAPREARSYFNETALAAALTR